jgi:hypothetical protein
LQFPPTALLRVRTKKPLTILAATPDVKIDIHGVEIGARICGICLATDEAGILDELFFGAMLENWLNANWTIEIHDLFEKGGMYFKRTLTS